MTACRWPIAEPRVLLSGAALCWSGFPVCSGSEPEWFVVACGAVLLRPCSAREECLTAPSNRQLLPCRRAADTMKSCSLKQAADQVHTVLYVATAADEPGHAGPYSSRFRIPEVNVAPSACACPVHGQQTGDPHGPTRLHLSSIWSRGFCGALLLPTSTQSCVFH